MKGMFKSLLSKKLAVLVSHKVISIAVATVIIAGTSTVVIAYSYNKVSSNQRNKVAAIVKEKASNQSKYDAAKAVAGNRLSEILLDLNKLGYTVGKDNTVDATTYVAILKFQNDAGLTANGLPGDDTFNKLEYVVHRRGLD